MTDHLEGCSELRYLLKIIRQRLRNDCDGVVIAVNVMLLPHPLFLLKFDYSLIVIRFSELGHL